MLGLHTKEEIIGLDRCIMNPEHPVMAIIGGAKMSSKLPVIEALLKSGSLDVLVVGGAMAHTFLKAKGVSVGNSLCEDSAHMQSLARDIMRECERSKVGLLLPFDFVLGAATKEENGKEVVCNFATKNVGLVADRQQKTEVMIVQVVEKYCPTFQVVK